jgi:hypothetical protein
MTDARQGDRRTLTSLELITLDEKVLPAARRWLRLYPQMAHHAVNTLAHWGEPLIDDHGKSFNAPTNRMDTAE